MNDFMFEKKESLLPLQVTPVQRSIPGALGAALHLEESELTTADGGTPGIAASANLMVLQVACSYEGEDAE
jgi:hypothetical protein